jgi:hypothetical protein
MAASANNESTASEIEFDEAFRFLSDTLDRFDTSRIFADQRNFRWLSASVAGFMVAREYSGLTSVVRALDLYTYSALEHFYDGAKWSRNDLQKAWIGAIRDLSLFHTFNGRIVLVGDGTKMPYEGLKMASVIRLHQDSEQCHVFMITVFNNNLLYDA